MSNVKINNQDVDFAAALNLMDDEIREAIHNDNGSSMTEQEFADAYCAAHATKYGVDFEVN